MKTNVQFVQKQGKSLQQVHLYFPDSFKPRIIGNYNPKEKSFFTTRNESQIHHKTQSIAFNYDLVKDNRIEMFIVDYNGCLLYMTRNYALKIGKVYQFNAYEVQVFCPIKEFSLTPSSAKQQDDNSLTLFS